MLQNPIIHAPPLALKVIGTKGRPAADAVGRREVDAHAGMRRVPTTTRDELDIFYMFR